MDLMFLLTHCHDSVLPEDFELTKMQIRHYFPNVFDTKVMATEYSDAQIKGSSSVLGDLFDSLKHANLDEPFYFPIITNNKENEEPGKGQAHEAAWDAYMTGSIFNALGKRILESRNVLKFNLSFNALLLDSSESLMREYLGLNMLYMHMSLYTIDLESSSGPAGLNDPLSCGLSIDTTFHVRGINTSVSTRDILQALMAGSEGEDDIIRQLKYDIIWVDDVSFFVGTSCEEVISLDDSSTLKFIATHVRNKLHDGLGSVDILSLKRYFEEKDIAKAADSGGGFAKTVLSLAAAPFRMLKRAIGSSDYEPTNKKRRLG
jgi:hypothetical protein